MEARYPYQVYDLNVALEENRISEKNLPLIIKNFHEIHLQYYACQDPQSHIEVTALRVSAIGKTPKPRINGIYNTKKDEKTALKGIRKTYFRDVRDFIETSIFDGDKLDPGYEISGPAIVEETITTIVIPQNNVLTVTKYGNYFLKIS